nr:phospholipase D family protein [Pseudomonas baltica]
MKTPWFALLLACLALGLAGCSSIPGPHTYSEMLRPETSSFGRSVLADAQAHPGQSGFRLLPNSGEAFRARAELIRNAQTSLDLQYYIVQDGLSTRLLIEELLKAADRGVRVRILLDDTTSDGIDEFIATLAAHPNIHIRLFNPLHLGRMTGTTRALGRLLNLSQQHRRMHNKLWLADDAMAIVGGRNLGDEYFDAEPNLNFTDIDLLGAGPVARQLGYSFDQYWNSALSRPIGELYGRLTRKDLSQARRQLDAALIKSREANRILYDQLMSYQARPQLSVWRQEMIWAPSQVMWDAPSKVLSQEPDPHLLLTTQLLPKLESVKHELILISAYFVPAQPGLVFLTGMADSGVDVSLLTNALEATDVPAVHGGYAPYRKALLEHGVHLYELRRQPGDDGRVRYRSGSESSLHSKAMILDRRMTFIGSFNFDPRSVLWNTEVGVMVDSPELAEHVRNLALQGMSPVLSYHVQLQNEQMVWVTEDHQQMHTLKTEPGDWWRRLNAWFAKSVGLERML